MKLHGHTRHIKETVLRPDAQFEAFGRKLSLRQMRAILVFSRFGSVVLVAIASERFVGWAATPGGPVNRDPVAGLLFLLAGTTLFYIPVRFRLVDDIPT